MYDILTDTFQSTLNREGKEIDINGTKSKVFFRRNNEGDTDAYMTLFAPLQAQINQGNVFDLRGSKHLILKALTAENDVYQKYKAVKTNGQIKWQFGKNDLVIFDVYTSSFSESLRTMKSGTVISSKVEFIFPLNSDSKRIGTNDRFFCGSFHMAWKVTELHYTNNMCYVYAERDPILPDDDVKNGIADRYKYEPRPATYKVVFEINEITIEELEEKVVKYTIYKDGVPLDHPPLSQKFIVENGKYMLADDVSNDTVTEQYFKVKSDNENIWITIEQGQIKITGMIVGTSKITASYSMSADDTVIADNIDVKIVEKPVDVGEIEIVPVYTDSTYYKLKQGYSPVTFKASISGVDAPSWTITMTVSGSAVVNTNYTSVIDDNKGIFTASCVKKTSTIADLDYKIVEVTSGKVANYKVRLWGMM